MDLTELMQRGSAVVSETDGASRLRYWAELLVEQMNKLPGFGVVAASPQAERVLGAAMMLDSEIRGATVGPVVVFDLNYSSGTLLSRKARGLRDQGNHSCLVGVVLNPLINQVRQNHDEEFESIRFVTRSERLRNECKHGVNGIPELVWS